MTLRLRKIALTVVVVYVAVLGSLLLVMRQPKIFGKLMRYLPGPALAVVPAKQLWFVARAGRLREGDVAPDFVLSSADKQSRVRLSAFHGQEPVVLVFGSYT